MKEMWDKRYSASSYAYGTKPNVFFKTQMKLLTPGATLLFPAEGEGRNAVFAARQNFNVYAFDISAEAKRKAELLAQTKNVQLTYEVGNFLDLDMSSILYDGIVLIYAHFPNAIRRALHQRFVDQLKPGGYLILEGFCQQNLKYRKKNPSIGGPPSLDMLFSKEMIHEDFKELKTLLLEEKEVVLAEGLYHNGTGMVLRYIGQKL